MDSKVDHRRVPRFSINFPVKISPDINATITNVSETGLGFDCTEVVSPIEKIPIFAEIFSESMTPQERIPVKIIWFKDSSVNKSAFGASFFSAVTVSQLLSQLR